jgi:hypothetical protein
MSTPISEALRAAALLAGLGGLAACDQAGLSGGTPTRTTLNVAGQPVTLAAPPGFCIDGDSTSVTDAGAFVLMSDCALLGAGDADPAVGAALTASVSAGGLTGEGDDPAQDLPGLAEFAASPEGRQVLGRSGRSDAVRILATETRGDVLYLLVEDRGPQPIAGIDRRFWRAFLELNGRMTVLSVLGFEGAGVDAQAGLNHLVAFADTLQAVN